MYIGGNLIKMKEIEASISDLMVAASQGSPNAQYNLAVMYRDGIGMQKDEKQAAYWFNKAGNAGHLTALMNLGVLYEDGRGVEKNYTIAAKLYEKAVANGHIGSMKNLSNLYFEGKGVPMDLEKGFELRGKAALEGDMNSFRLLMSAAFEAGQPIAKKIIEKYWDEYMKIDSFQTEVRSSMLDLFKKFRDM